MFGTYNIQAISLQICTVSWVWENTIRKTINTNWTPTNYRVKMNQCPFLWIQFQSLAFLRDNPTIMDSDYKFTLEYSLGFCVKLMDSGEREKMWQRKRKARERKRITIVDIYIFKSGASLSTKHSKRILRLWFSRYGDCIAQLVMRLID